ncbi:hypothetical protein D3C83_73540 [compost metagenome]
MDLLAAFETDEGAVDAVVEQVEVGAHQLDGEVLARCELVRHHQVAIGGATDAHRRPPLVHAQTLLVEREQQTAGVARNELLGMQVDVGQVQIIDAP